MLHENRDIPVTSSEFVPTIDAVVMALAGLGRPSATVFYSLGAGNERSDFELFGLAETMHRIYLPHYCTLDLLHPSHCGRQTRSVLTLASAWPDSARDSSVYWGRFPRPRRVVDVTEVLLRDSARTVAAVSPAAMVPDGGFRADELSRSQALQPVLGAALVALSRGEHSMRTDTGGRPPGRITKSRSRCVSAMGCRTSRLPAMLPSRSRLSRPICRICSASLVSRAGPN